MILGGREHHDKSIKWGEIEEVLVITIFKWKSLYQITCQATNFNI